MSRYPFLPKAGKQYKSYQVETRRWLNINIQQPFVFLYLGPWLEQSKFWPNLMLPKLSELSIFKVHLVFQSCLHSSPNTGGTLMPCMFSYYWIGQKVRLSFSIRCNGKIQTNVLGNSILFYRIASYYSQFGTWVDSLQTTICSIHSQWEHYLQVPSQI